MAFEFLRQWRSRVRGLVLMDTRAEADTPEVRRARDAAAATARERGARLPLPTRCFPRCWLRRRSAAGPKWPSECVHSMARTPVAGHCRSPGRHA